MIFGSNTPTMKIPISDINWENAVTKKAIPEVKLPPPTKENTAFLSIPLDTTGDGPWPGYRKWKAKQKSDRKRKRP
jgi:hypothetical protein